MTEAKKEKKKQTSKLPLAMNKILHKRTVVRVLVTISVLLMTDLF